MRQPLLLVALEGTGEVQPGDDLAALVVAGLTRSDTRLADGDVVVVTSKVVSKAEGRLRAGDREDAVDGETVRVVARRGDTRIVQNRQGLVMAAAGVDASNVAPGQVVLLPEDPDASARALRTALREHTGRNAAVLVTDTAGRPWRVGQTDIAIGVAGIEPVEDYSGRVDDYGNPLAVTAPAVADEIAAAAELVTGKLGGRPFTVVRGLGQRVLPAGEHGPGAGVLQRPREQDMFALGAREAVLAALRRVDARSFGAPVPPTELADALVSCGIAAVLSGDTIEVAVDAADPVLGAVLHAHRWAVVDPAEVPVRLAPVP